MHVYVKGDPMPRLRERFENLDGPGRAFLTRQLGTPQSCYSGFPGGRDTWQEVTPDYRAGEDWDSLLARLAASGCDLLFKRTQSGGKARLFYRKG